MDTETIALLKLVYILAQEIAGCGEFESPEYEAHVRAYIRECADLILVNVRKALPEPGRSALLTWRPCGPGRGDGCEK